MILNKIGNQIYETLFSSFTEVCIVPAYIVHQSDDSEDYSIYFQVEEITENLNNGIFKIPKIEIWSGRGDINRANLAKNLRSEFILQMEIEKQKKLQAHSKDRENLSDDSEVTKSNLTSKISWLGSAIATALLISNPIADAVILFIAVTSGKSAFSEIIKMLRLSISSWSGKTNKEKEKELEEEIKSKKGVIDEALENMDIKLHPLMYKAAHTNYGISATSAKGIVINAEPLPAFIENLITDDY